MAARPPTSNDDDDPAAFVFGIAAVETYLEDADLDWPATNDEIIAATGDPSIPLDPHGRTTHLSAVLDDVDVDRFDSRRHLLNATHPVFEARRRSHSGGILGQLRSLLPF